MVDKMADEMKVLYQNISCRDQAVEAGIIPSSEEVYKPPPSTKVKKRPIRRKSGIARMSKNTKENDVEWIEAQAAEKLGRDLVQYMKDYWKIQVTQVSSLLEVSYRTMELVEKKKPPDYWMTRRARELYAEHTALFSDVRKPYESLGEVELETDWLVFNNLPPQLLIDPSDWFRLKRLRDEEERRKKAPCKKLPRVRLGRPRYDTGGMKVGTGGKLAMDTFVKTGGDDHKGKRGSMTFTQMLTNWREDIENEAANAGSEFRVVEKTTNFVSSSSSTPSQFEPK